jgi:undecaprenyl-diphosphatase
MQQRNRLKRAAIWLATTPMQRADAHSTFRDRHPTSFNPDRLAIARGKSGLTIASVALGVFALLFVIVRTRRSAATDAAITLRLQKRNHPILDRILKLASWPGFPPQSRVLPPAFSAMLWIIGFRLEAIFQMLAWGTGAISFSVKRVMRRPRPGPDQPLIRVAVANIGGSSFPSGHVLNYMGVYGFLSYLAFTWIRPTLIRRVIIGMLTSLLALVGPSRVYLGHHWFTDVMASYCLGVAYLIGITSIYRRIRRLISGF